MTYKVKTKRKESKYFYVGNERFTKESGSTFGVKVGDRIVFNDGGLVKVGNVFETPKTADSYFYGVELDNGEKGYISGMRIYGVKK